MDFIYIRITQRFKNCYKKNNGKRLILKDYSVIMAAAGGSIATGLSIPPYPGTLYLITNCLAF